MPPLFPNSVFYLLTPNYCSSKYFYVIIQQADFRHTADHIQHMIHGLIQVGFIVTYGRHGQGRLLPEIIVCDFRNRHVEFVPNPVFQTAERMSLCLERTAVRNMELDMTNTDKHVTS